MALYEILWKRSATKELRDLPKDKIKKILSSVVELSSTPFPPGVRKLAGSEHSYRLRVGDYRVVYTVESQMLVIEILRVGHRQNIYR
jgi:mRNA interferase RelE/StbE